MSETFLTNHTPRWIVFIIDLAICFVSIICAYLLRLNFNLEAKELDLLPKTVLIVISVRSILFLVFKTYAGLIRYTSAKDTERIFVVSTAGTLALFTINWIFYTFQNNLLIPNSILIIDFLITVFALTFFRFVIKWIYSIFVNPQMALQNVVLFGIDNFGLTTKRTLETDTSSDYKVVAFIDPNNKDGGKKLDGLNIYNTDKLDHIIEKYGISSLIITQNKIDAKVKEELVEKCLAKNVKALTIPNVQSWINGQLSAKQIKRVKIEDLLERAPIQLDEEKIKDEILNKVVLVTGAAGSIGSEIVRQVTKFKPKKIILFDQAETPLYDIELELKEKLNFYDFEIVIGDVTNSYRVNKMFESYHPNIVFHAAAYKHVPMMENNPTEAILTNVWGTKNIADYAVLFGVSKFIMISTDKAVNPTNIMGASKRVAEIYIQALNKENKTNFITTRFGNVLGSNGSVIPRFRKQIESGGPITITHPEITRFFMTIPEACQLVLEAGAMGTGGEIFIFDMGESVKILDMAKKMIQLSGLTLGKDINITFTGLRPGEKLYEELLNDKENTLPTYHPKIMIAKVREYDLESVKEEIKGLIEKVPFHNNFIIVKKMKTIVPEFKSQNSIFEELDKNILSV